MARITVEDCLEKVDNQYDLVLLAKERTVQLNAGSPMLVEEDNDKRTIISLREIGDGKIDVKEVEASAIKRLRKEPDELEEQDDDGKLETVEGVQLRVGTEYHRFSWLSFNIVSDFHWLVGHLRLPVKTKLTILTIFHQ